MLFKLNCLAAVAATLALSVVAMPTNLTTTLLPRGGEGEPFECPDPSVTAAAKRALIEFGAKPVGTSSPNVSECDRSGAKTAGLYRHRDRHVGERMCLPRPIHRRQQQEGRLGRTRRLPQQLAYDPRVLRRFQRCGAK